MARALDPKIGEVLKAHGFDKSAVWDCHGTWVVYHRVLEQIAAKTGISFDYPVVLEANGKEKCVALCVGGQIQQGEGMRKEWSIGEAGPGNNKNAYPYAMAEKRAKDRVVLKLIGLHGLAYSEEESDSFGPPGRDITYGVGNGDPTPPNMTLWAPWGEMEAEYDNPEAYLEALSQKLDQSGAYWDSNKHVVEWLGKEYAGSLPEQQAKAIKQRARAVYKLGQDARRNYEAAKNDNSQTVLDAG